MTIIIWQWHSKKCHKSSTKMGYSLQCLGSCALQTWPCCFAYTTLETPQKFFCLRPWPLTIARVQVWWMCLPDGEGSRIQKPGFVLNTVSTHPHMATIITINIHHHNSHQNYNTIAHVCSCMVIMYIHLSLLLPNMYELFSWDISVVQNYLIHAPVGFCFWLFCFN